MNNGGGAESFFQNGPSDVNEHSMSPVPRSSLELPTAYDQENHWETNHEPTAAELFGADHGSDSIPFEMDTRDDSFGLDDSFDLQDDSFELPQHIEGPKSPCGSSPGPLTASQLIRLGVKNKRSPVPALGSSFKSDVESIASSHERMSMNLLNLAKVSSEIQRCAASRDRQVEREKEDTKKVMINTMTALEKFQLQTMMSIENLAKQLETTTQLLNRVAQDVQTIQTQRSKPLSPVVSEPEEDIQTCITDFFKRHMPQEVESIPAMIQQYKGHEEDLVFSLGMRFGNEIFQETRDKCFCVLKKAHRKTPQAKEAVEQPIPYGEEVYPGFTIPLPPLTESENVLNDEYNKTPQPSFVEQPPPTVEAANLTESENVLNEEYNKTPQPSFVEQPPAAESLVPLCPTFEAAKTDDQNALNVEYDMMSPSRYKPFVMGPDMFDPTDTSAVYSPNVIPLSQSFAMGIANVTNSPGQPKSPPHMDGNGSYDFPGAKVPFHHDQYGSYHTDTSDVVVNHSFNDISHDTDSLFSNGNATQDTITDTSEPKPVSPVAPEASPSPQPSPVKGPPLPAANGPPPPMGNVPTYRKPVEKKEHKHPQPPKNIHVFRPQAPPPAVDSPSGLRRRGPKAKEVEKTEETSTEEAAPPPSLPELLKKFYTTHQPDKLKNVPAMVKAYTGHERRLIDDLRGKYGARSVQELQRHLPALEKAAAALKPVKAKRSGCSLLKFLTVSSVCMGLGSTGMLVLGVNSICNSLDGAKCSETSSPECFCQSYQENYATLWTEPNVSNAMRVLSDYQKSLGLLQPEFQERIRPVMDDFILPVWLFAKEKVIAGSSEYGQAVDLVMDKLTRQPDRDSPEAEIVSENPVTQDPVRVEEVAETLEETQVTDPVTEDPVHVAEEDTVSSDPVMEEDVTELHETEGPVTEDVSDEELTTVETQDEQSLEKVAEVPEKLAEQSLPTDEQVEETQDPVPDQSLPTDERVEDSEYLETEQSLPTDEQVEEVAETQDPVPDQSLPTDERVADPESLEPDPVPDQSLPTDGPVEDPESLEPVEIDQSLPTDKRVEDPEYLETDQSLPTDEQVEEVAETQVPVPDQSLEPVETDQAVDEVAETPEQSETTRYEDPVAEPIEEVEDVSVATDEPIDENDPVAVVTEDRDEKVKPISLDDDSGDEVYKLIESDEYFLKPTAEDEEEDQDTTDIPPVVLDDLPTETEFNDYMNEAEYFVFNNE